MTEMITRRNPVLEALRGDRRALHRLWLQSGLPRKQAGPLLHEARRRGVAVEEAGKQKLSQLAGAGDHQGVVLEAGPYRYAAVDEMMERAAERNEQPFILSFDLIQGTSNVGTLLRTAEICGVHGVIIQERRAPDITPLIVQNAQGATEHLLIAQVTNLGQALDELKEREVWIAGLDTGEDAYGWGEIDLNRPLCLVVGHEGEGLRRLVREKCDFILRLPMRGHVESLNAAVAGSVALYAAWQARGFEGG